MQSTMSASKHSERKDDKEDCRDTPLTQKGPTSKMSPDEQVKSLHVIFESVKEILTSPDYDENLRDELTAACPNFMFIFETAKRDLIRNDCGILVTGETSAGKSTLINLLIEKTVLVTSNTASTGTITRIRNSEELGLKCYSEDQLLEKHGNIQDIKTLKSVIKKFTGIKNSEKDLKAINYVDVYLPVPFLKGNVIFVDTPGIGECDRLDEILLDFLPQAVSFVFVLNAKNAGGVHTHRLSKIMETVIEQKEKMPCFDPREVMFITNQWDIIEKYEHSSDDEDDENSKKDDQHAITWNKIQDKLKKEWEYYDVNNVFRVSLKQIIKEKDAKTGDAKEMGKCAEESIDKGAEKAVNFSDEYNRFVTMLKSTIDKNKNKRVEYYYRFLSNFIKNAWRGTLVRCRLLGKSENERKRTVRQNRVRITDLKVNCSLAKLELERYKPSIIDKLTTKLNNYLHSSKGREDILNAPGAIEISEVQFKEIQDEVHSRFRYAIKRWCVGHEVKLIIEDATEKIRSLSRDLDIELREIEFAMTGIHTRGACINYNMTTIDAFDGFHILFASIFVIVFALLIFPLVLFDKGRFLLASLFRRCLALDTYNACLKQISKPKLQEIFEKSFGKEFNKMVVQIFDESLLKTIENLLRINERLNDDIQQKQESLMRLEENIRKIQIATEKFESLLPTKIVDDK